MDTNPTRLTLTFDRRALYALPEETFDEFTAWLASFGLRPARIPSEAPVVFDLTARTVTTQYLTVAEGTDPDAKIPQLVLDGAGGVLKEKHVAPYLAETLPEIPQSWRHVATAATGHSEAA
jgi:hypothetical protein